MELTAWQVGGLLGLVLFGLVYNSFVAWLQEHNAGSVVALQVIVGTLVVLLVEWLTVPAGTLYNANQWLLLTLLHFACAGLPMTVGSYQRRP